MSHKQPTTSFLSRKEAAAYLSEMHGVTRTPATLAFLACKGGGPIFRKDGPRKTIYARPDLDAYAASVLSKPMRSTSEAA